MIFVFLSNTLIYLTFIGFAHLYLNFTKKKYKEIKNLDTFYGIVLLIIISIFFNFFIEIRLIQLLIIIFGITLFISCLIKKKVKINFFYILPVIFITSYISFYSNYNVDSPMYHLQILKWQTEYKTVLGISNLEIRFGDNSTWHSLVSITDINFNNFSTKYFLSSVIISIAIYEIFNNFKTYTLNHFFLNFSFIILFFFSLIHPFKNGPILNHLGNPDLDIVPMTMFLISIFILIKFYEEKNKELFQLYIFCAFFCVTSRIIYLPLIIPIIYHYTSTKNINNFNFYFLSFGGSLWLIKSFLNSGCLIFPYKFTCLNVNWSPGKENIKYHLNEVMSYSRDGPFRSKYKDFDYTLNSLDWFYPWINNYYLESAFLILFSLIILVSFVIILLGNLIKRKPQFVQFREYKVIIFILLITFTIWFSAPEIRLGIGVLLALPAFLFTYSLNKYFYNYVKKFYNYASIIFFIIFSLFFIKNFNLFLFNNFLSIPDKIHDYRDINKLGNFDGYDIFVSNSWKCADFKKICVNKPKQNYNFTEKLGYTIILNEN